MRKIVQIQVVNQKMGQKVWNTSFGTTFSFLTVLLQLSMSVCEKLIDEANGNGKDAMKWLLQ